MAALGWLGRPSMGQAEMFQPPHFGYQLEIPQGWVQSTTSRAYTALFVPENSLGVGLASVMVVNLPRSATVGITESVEQAAAQYAQEITTKAQNGAVLRQVPFRWDMGDAVVMGVQIVATFSADGIAMQQWAVFLPQPKAQVIHLWQYTASAGDFDHNLPAAQAILESLKPVTNTAEKAKK